MRPVVSQFVPESDNRSRSKVINANSVLELKQILAEACEEKVIFYCEISEENVGSQEMY